MATREKEYRRLPGRGIRRQGIATAARTRLWLGKDHLLQVDSQWYTEDYRRFYFKDIQAFIICKTTGGKVGNIVLGVTACFPLILCLAFSLNRDIGWAVFWGIVGGFLGLFLLANVLMGPTCTCHVKTAVQTEELTTLRRLPRARKVLRRVRPLLAEAQGQLSPEEMASYASQPGNVEAAPPVITADVLPPPPQS